MPSRNRAGLLSRLQRSSVRPSRLGQTVRLKLRDRRMPRRNGPPTHRHSSVRRQWSLVHKNGIGVRNLNLRRRSVSPQRSGPLSPRPRAGPSRHRSATRPHRLQSNAGRHLLPHKSEKPQPRLVLVTKRNGKTIVQLPSWLRGTSQSPMKDRALPLLQVADCRSNASMAVGADLLISFQRRKNGRGAAPPPRNIIPKKKRRTIVLRMYCFVPPGTVNMWLCAYAACCRNQSLSASRCTKMPLREYRRYP